ncbi:hypothetical protein [Methanobrevibacter curvatus]|uniref:Uncharacterized protein n=1 Tax=Methanobrevibacter curvatus TaxID=49547 RepID=A0A166D7A5_9EURY|nr:hypothetical protein [Methanobrevibacter curvatus]KZX15279.1 hypothetical protein MBCUR_02760 [Methanobrevibacter curvatus]
MSKILKFLLIIILFLGFFEAGLLSSYTIITSETPDVKGLLDFQLESLSSIFSQENINNIIIKDPEIFNISNPVNTAEIITNLTNVDGVNIDYMNATSYESGEKFIVKINSYGYAPANITKGQIVLSTIPNYKIIASAEAEKSGKNVKIDTETIKIVSIFKLYNATPLGYSPFDV